MARIVITGASRGIGAALARLYAVPGASLLLIGRDEARLSEVADSCRKTGAAAELRRQDIRDRDGMAALLAGADAEAPVDLVIANAGIALPTAEALGQDSTVYGEIETNFLGALNTILPLADRMAGRGRGQIALVSSLAAFAPLPNSPGYSASKAGLLVYGLALRERLRPVGVRVNVICPGYIDTEMGTRYLGWRPLAMSADAAALRIRRGLERDQPIVAFPRRLAAAARATQFIPEALLRLGLSAFRFKIDKPR